MTVFLPPSADSVALLTADLHAKVDAAHAGEVGADLAAVAEVLRHEGALRRIFTDAAVATDAEIVALRSLFGGKIADQALDFVIAAVSHRWRSGNDLPAAFDALATTALMNSAGADGARVIDELFQVRQTVRHSDELLSALTDPVYSVEAKKGLLDSLLDGKVHPVTVAIVRQAVGAPGPFLAAMTELRVAAAKALGGIAAVITVAKPLANGEVDKISAALTADYGKPVYANVLVDPSVLGGVRVELGDDVIDGTVQTRLDEAGRRLAG